MPPKTPDNNAAEAALRSVHTNTFPPLLKQLQSSLLVSTYQAGKLVIVREDGNLLNTHFRVFERPMGMAVRNERFALGSQCMVEEFRNMPAVAQRLQPQGKHDAAYLPRRTHVTGDIDIHEMDYDANGKLWFINTRFSCLCTLDAEHSFNPEWRPPFISAYSPTDRCHLNGLAMRDGKPRYVTALGHADTDAGWREHKADGGILMDIATNEMIVEGLSMPHSPRWYDGKLWLLESGKGGIGYVDFESGKIKTVATLPGFTRGLDFAGPFAFIGISQVRESATFSGIPLTKELSERNCGVWVVDLRNGETVAFLRFEEAVQEIFAVSLLRGVRFPDVINHDENLIKLSYSLSDEALKDAFVPKVKDSAALHQQQGVKHFKDGNWQEAEQAFNKALQLQADFLPARAHLGMLFNELGRYDEAITALLDVIANEAAHADAHHALGFAYSKQRKIDTAITHFRKAIKIRPELAEAHLSLSMQLLLKGEYTEGWKEYEWRWKTAEFTPFEPGQHPRWDGQPLPDGTLLIHTEQGNGDAMQFLRFLPEVASRCAHILMVAPIPLHPLLDGLATNLSYREAGALDVKDFDAYLPIMSLPLVLGMADDSDIPKQLPTIAANPASLPLVSDASKLKVGLVWAGSPTFGNDKYRSIAFEKLSTLLAQENIQWFSLQKGDAVNALKTLPAGINIQNLDAKLTTYGDTAAAIAQLDLVISVDTSVCHLAGILGCETWVLLAFDADWRWQQNRLDSPWYPNTRLFRQQELGGWDEVVSSMKTALDQRLLQLQ